jgi:hypothetical protein
MKDHLPATLPFLALMEVKTGQAILPERGV